MASHTTHECDGCGRSIADPGTISIIELRTYGLKNGDRFIDNSYKSDDFDLCSSCMSNVSKALDRVLPAQPAKGKT